MTLNKAQRFTLIGMAVALGLFVLLVAGLVVLEGHAVVVGQHSSISEVFWWIWAEQPWVIWLWSVLVAFITGFFAGHFLAQSSEKYDQIREKGLE